MRTDQLHSGSRSSTATSVNSPTCVQPECRCQGYERTRLTRTPFYTPRLSPPTASRLKQHVKGSVEQPPEPDLSIIHA
ncbi:hypothetical protein LENED_001856 [Lentinula edodes]|uniref:Uncharacterized protein n=1 Tax=Lentinula edodes TaxID=5353 RepID=A0A1Q3DZA6_LENED|nr:hypothetical protein LENED_001856 [Lentinula edodes]